MIVLFYTFIGATLGSLATFLIHRFSHDEPVIKANKQSTLSPHRSACTACKTKLSIIELIPIISWIIQGGRCRTCAAPISKLYPMTEILCAAAGGLVGIQFGLGYEGVIVLASIPILYAMAVVDLRRFILPDPLMAAFFICGVIYVINAAFINGGIKVIIDHTLSGIVYGGLSWGIARLMAMALKKEALGFGDVKFFAVAGLWLGVSALPLFLIISGVIGVVFGGIWRIVKAGQAGGDLFPFGPALIVSFLTLLFYYEDLDKLFL